MKKINDELVKTAALQLTINSPNEPKNIKIAYMNVLTRPFYPRPRRCYKCFNFGHIALTCSAKQLCYRCGDNFHGDTCEKASKCTNCKTNEHYSTSNKCPLWIKKTEIIKLKVDSKITFEEARKTINDRKKSSFADVTTTSLTEKHQQEIKTRDNQIKNLADLLEKSVAREEKANATANSFQEQLIFLENKLDKCLKHLTEERAARKRAEKEYDTLAKYVEKLKKSQKDSLNEKLKEKSQKHKHNREQLHKQNSLELSPIRKKNCNRADSDAAGKPTVKQNSSIFDTDDDNEDMIDIT